MNKAFKRYRNTPFAKTRYCKRRFLDNWRFEFNIGEFVPLCTDRGWDEVTVTPSDEFVRLLDAEREPLKVRVEVARK